MRTAIYSQTTTAKPNSFLIQRKCGCGKQTKNRAEVCPECRKEVLQAKLKLGSVNDPLEKEADTVAEKIMTGSKTGSISTNSHQLQTKTESLQLTQNSDLSDQFIGQLQDSSAGGKSLDSSSRQFFEARFARDFSSVKIHDNAQSAALASHIQAKAFTVANHIYFGQQATNNPFLMAHELTHVVQQTNPTNIDGINSNASSMMIQRLPLGQESAFERYERGATLPYREATNMVDCLRIMGNDSRAYCERQVLGQATPESQIDECIRQNGADPALRHPNRALNWADFQATAPAGGTYTAKTYANIVARTMTSKVCVAQAYQSSNVETRGFQARFDPASSWVKSAFGSNANQNNVNGCSQNITTCENHINATPNAWWAMSTTVNPQCPASAIARGDRATTLAECTSIVGQDCNDRALAESTRLLRHEQGHYDIAHVVARKAQAALDAGSNFDTLLPIARRNLQQTQNQYDAQTTHGCIAAQQQTWETNIANNLPAVTVP